MGSTTVDTSAQVTIGSHHITIIVTSPVSGTISAT